MAAHTGPTVQGNTFTVDNTSGGIEIAPARKYPRRVYVYTLDGAEDVFIGGDSGLTAANGLPLSLESSPMVFDLAPIAVLHAIAATSSDVRVLELQPGATA